VWIELTNRSDQTHATFGDQVAERHAIAPVLKPNGNDVPHVRFDEPVCGVLVPFARAKGELMLFLAGEFRDGPDLLDVSIEGGG